MQDYKIVVVGPAKGKSTLVHRALDVDPPMGPTLGVEVHPIYFNTNRGHLHLNVWDCASNGRFEGFREGYYREARGAIVFGDDDNEQDEYVQQLPEGISVVRLYTPLSANVTHQPFIELMRLMRNDPGLIEV